MTISEVIKSADTKGHAFNVEAIENGFKVGFSYRLKNTQKKESDYDYWEYKSKTYFFPNWAELVKFIGENEVPQPPQ